MPGLLQRAIAFGALAVLAFPFIGSKVHADGAVLTNGGASDFERLVEYTLTEACYGARGEIDYNDVVFADVNGDGREDIIIDHRKIRCFGETGGASAFCGMSGNCTVTVYHKAEFGWAMP